MKQSIIKYGRYIVYSDGNVFSLIKNKYLKHTKTKNTYRQVTLYDQDKVKHKFNLHRLIAESFIPNIDNKCCVNHIDGDKLNNDISNLEWVSILQNNVHAYKTGLKVLPKKGNAKISKKVIQYDIDGVTVIKIHDCIICTEEDGFIPSSVTKCCKGKIKTHKGFIWKYK